MATEPSNEAVDAMLALGRWPAEMERLLQAALPIERNRWEQEVRERLLSEEGIDAMAAVMCHYSSAEAFRSHGVEKHGEEWGHWRRVEARLQLETFARLFSIFGEAEPVDKPTTP